MKKQFIGFYRIGGYDYIVVDETEDLCWKAMKREFFEWRKHNKKYFWESWMESFDKAKEWFGWNVQELEKGKMIEH